MDQILETPAELEDILAVAATEDVVALFAAYGVPTQQLHAMRPPDSFGLLGVIGFAGVQLSGTLVLGMTPELLSASNPTTSSARDWIAELTNQLLGRVKNRMLRRGIEFYAVPPSVVSGTRLAPVSRPDSDFRPLIFGFDNHPCACVWFDVEFRPPLVLAPVRRLDAPGEGDLILF